MNYISTRGNYPIVQSTEAIAQGMVPKGGLFVPETIPQIDLDSLRGLNYRELAEAVLMPYMTGGEKNYKEEEVRSYIQQAYTAQKFESDNVAPLSYLNESTAVLELWHGPTAAFKDMALQIMPYFLTGAIKKLGKKREVVILVATSGDTGKAALEGYKDVPGTRIIVFYPKDGVSRVQELQMLTTAGGNTAVVGVQGNFDDCQNLVKKIFGDATYNNALNRNGFELSSANSINWGRLAPQIVYYFWAYLQMVKDKKIVDGDPINAVVPTGNFGNILAGYYASQMGLPIRKFVCASNRNNVLSDFIQTGIYNRKREFYKTSSPSMDILISSNLERFLFAITGNNARKINRWYDDLAAGGEFKVDDSTRQRLKSILYGNYSTEEETFAQIKKTYQDSRYVLDPHTAVGVSVHNKYLAETGDKTPAFICGTASPYKFNQAVYQALTGDTETSDEIEMAARLQKLTDVPIHRALLDIEKLPVKHNKVIKLQDGKEAVNQILGVKI